MGLKLFVNDDTIIGEKSFELCINLGKLEQNEQQKRTLVRADVLVDVRATVLVDVRATVLVDMRATLLVDVRAAVLVDVRATVLVDVRAAVLVDVRATVLVDVRATVLVDVRAAVLVDVRAAVLVDVRATLLVDVRATLLTVTLAYVSLLNTAHDAERALVIPYTAFACLFGSGVSAKRKNSFFFFLTLLHSFRSNPLCSSAWSSP